VSGTKMTKGGITFGPPGRGPQHIEIAQALEVDVKRWRKRAEEAESESSRLRSERDEATALANRNGAEADENAIALAEARSEVARLRAALGAAVAYLSEQEWSAWRSSDGGREDFIGAPCCPDCTGMEADGHESTCRIAALLAALRPSPNDAAKETRDE
jgi:hypothetical protein